MNTRVKSMGIGLIFFMGVFCGLLLPHGKALAALFSDLPGDAWYAPAVTHMNQLEVVKGYPDGTFRADQGLNRAEMVTMLSRYHQYLLEEYFPQRASADEKFLQDIFRSGGSESSKTPAQAANGNTDPSASVMGVSEHVETGKEAAPVKCPL